VRTPDPVDPAREDYQLARISVTVLLVTTVVLAALLLFLKWHTPEHPGRVFVELLGFPVLILLALFFGRRRRA